MLPPTGEFTHSVSDVPSRLQKEFHLTAKPSQRRVEHRLRHHIVQKTPTTQTLRFNRACEVSLCA